jgi:hypothetical protein
MYLRRALDSAQFFHHMRKATIEHEDATVKL